MVAFVATTVAAVVAAVILLPEVADSGHSARQLEPQKPVRITRRTALEAPGCGPAEAAAVVMRFAAAASRGDEVALDGVLAAQRTGRPGAPEPNGEIGFTAYSVTGLAPGDFSSYDRATVVAHLSERAAGGERFSLRQLAVYPAERPQIAGLSFIIRRDVPGAPPHEAMGKAGMNCGSRTLHVWAAGRRPADAFLPCVVPADWQPDDEVVACTAGPTARSLTRDFSVTTRGHRLRASCRAPLMRERVAFVLGALNGGRWASFGAAFAPRGELRSRDSARGRSAVAAFARRQYTRGVGWTATALAVLGESRAGGETTDYRLTYDVYANGAQTGRQVARLRIACAHGLIHRWAVTGQ